MDEHPDDSPGYCCAMAGMHMGHDEDCQAHGDKMSEHEHDWYIWKGPAGVTIQCRDPLCNRCLTGEEAEAMLNENAALKRENNHKLQYLIEAVGEEYMPKKWAKEYRTLLGADDE